MMDDLTYSENEQNPFAGVIEAPESQGSKPLAKKTTAAGVVELWELEGVRFLASRHGVILVPTQEPVVMHRVADQKGVEPSLGKSHEETPAPEVNIVVKPWRTEYDCNAWDPKTRKSTPVQAGQIVAQALDLIWFVGDSMDYDDVKSALSVLGNLKIDYSVQQEMDRLREQTVGIPEKRAWEHEPMRSL